VGGWQASWRAQRRGQFCKLCFRTIQVDSAQPLTLSLGSDDGIKVWLNGKAVHTNKVTRSLAADQDKVTVQLQAGENKLLMKIVNATGGSGFYFNAGDGLPEKIRMILKIAAQERGKSRRLSSPAIIESSLRNLRRHALNSQQSRNNRRIS